MELAEVYLPDLHPRSAHRKLQHWITIYPGLPGRLLSLGYHEGERVYSPAMVRAILESLGEPSEPLGIRVYLGGYVIGTNAGFL